ncbi:MAG: hypothetical protein SRB1_02233 [Desulfobacteraceae bacterium Eth-SRB1]|nr:MAG: hypothetical protein SRB1_02233 [Desulfobacteraceae bacterium Eth-SRB1]
MPINLESFLLVLEQEVTGYHTPVVDLIAVQTRDPFKASRRLFNEAPDVHALAGLSEERIRKLIHPVGFF